VCKSRAVYGISLTMETSHLLIIQDLAGPVRTVCDKKFWVLAFLCHRPVPFTVASTRPNGKGSCLRSPVRGVLRYDGVWGFVSYVCRQWGPFAEAEGHASLCLYYIFVVCRVEYFS